MTDKPKRPRDANQLAKFIVDTATGDEPVHEPDTSGQRKGGLKGGKALARRDAMILLRRLKGVAQKSFVASWWQIQADQ